MPSPDLTTLLKLRFPNYRFAAGAGVLPPSLELHDIRRRRLAARIRDEDAKALAGVIERIRWHYVALVDAFEGRRPLVWS